MTEVKTAAPKRKAQTISNLNDSDSLIVIKDAQGKVFKIHPDSIVGRLLFHKGGKNGCTGTNSN